MADDRHIENRFWPQLSRRLSDLVEFCVGEQKQFFTEFGTDVRVLQNVFLVFLTQFWLPRAGGGCSYRLRYTCYFHFNGSALRAPSFNMSKGPQLICDAAEYLKL